MNKIKIGKLSLFFIFILIYTYICLAEHTISYTCPEECIKNKTAVWQINITNNGEDDLNVVQLKLVDALTKKIIAESEEAELTVSDPDAISSNKTKLVSIAPGYSSTFTIQGKLPLPNYNNTLIYNFCLTTRNELEDWGDIGQTTSYCYKDNYTIRMIDCLIDDDCDSDSYCSNSSCLSLNCGECQYISSHACIDYGCCSNDDCKLNEVCSQHTCELISCNINSTNSTYYIANHSCSSEPCPDDEIIKGHACIKADCKDDEFISDYECKKLGCSFDEHAFNHSCLKLDCNENEGYVNNSCIALKCADTEFISGHNCEKLRCGVFQKPESHECLINTNFLIYTILIALIVFLFVLDLKKFKSAHRKKLVDVLMKKAKEREPAKK